MADGKIHKDPHLENPFVERELEDGRRYPCLKPTSPDAIRLATDQHAIAEALRTMPCSLGKKFGACYVIGLREIDRCKIGFTVNPYQRIKSIQTALWGDAVCFALFWSLSHSAGQLEYNSLQAAKKAGVRLKGEWVALSGEEAVRHVLSNPPAKFVDSRTMLDRWIRIAGEQPTPKRGHLLTIEDYYTWEQSRLA